MLLLLVYGRFADSFHRRAVGAGADSQISIVDEQLLEQLLRALQSGVFNRAFAAAFSDSAVVLVSWSESSCGVFVWMLQSGVRK